MAKLSIDDRDFQRAAAALTREHFSELAGQTVGFALLKSANSIRRHVRAAAKPHRRTGKMASHVQYTRTGTGLDTEIKVRVRSPVAHLVAEGARPHDIGLGKNATKALTIRGRSAANSANTGAGSKAIRSAGADVFAVRRTVHHPGYRPSSNFWEDGVHAAEPEIQEYVTAGAKTMVSNLAFRMRGR